MINEWGTVEAGSLSDQEGSHSEREAACLYKLCMSGYHGSAVYVLPSSLSSSLRSSLPLNPSCSLLQATLDVVMNLQFHYIEKLWQTFWYSTPPSSDGSTTIPNRSGFNVNMVSCF